MQNVSPNVAISEKKPRHGVVVAFKSMPGVLVGEIIVLRCAVGLDFVSLGISVDTSGSSNCQ